VSDDTSPGLEARIARVEAIAAALESDRLELDDALRLFEEGIRHLREAEILLKSGEVRIERLLGEAGGNVVSEPLGESDA
jgi:exodeoxyribonuclease VII small subunit